MSRIPCKQCNASGRAEFPGQLVSFSSANIPCGCGDGFVDEYNRADDMRKPGDFVKTEIRGKASFHKIAIIEDEPPRDGDLFFTENGVDTQTQVVKSRTKDPQSKILKAPDSSGSLSVEEMSETLAAIRDEAEASGVPIFTAELPQATNSSLLAKVDVLIDDLLNNDSLWVTEQKPPISTGLLGVDELIGGGWRPGINVALGFDNDCAVYAIKRTGAPSLTITRSITTKGRLEAPALMRLATSGSSCLLTSRFEEVLTAIRGTRHQLVTLLNYRSYFAGDYKSQATQMHELQHAVQESRSTLVLFDESVKMATQDISRNANVVLERKSDGDRHWYESTKNRYGEQRSTKKESKKPATRCITTDDFNKLQAGDLFTCRLDINLRALGVCYKKNPNHPGTFECTGRTRTEEQKQAEFASAYGKSPKPDTAPEPDTSAAITITVSGVVGSGKSTILDIIDIALRTRGITADVKGEDADFYNRGRHTNKKLGALKQKGLTVTLEHKQLPRQR